MSSGSSSATNSASPQDRIIIDPALIRTLLNDCVHHNTHFSLTTRTGHAVAAKIQSIENGTLSFYLSSTNLDLKKFANQTLLQGSFGANADQYCFFCRQVEFDQTAIRMRIPDHLLQTVRRRHFRATISSDRPVAIRISLKQPLHNAGGQVLNISESGISFLCNGLPADTPIGTRLGSVSLEFTAPRQTHRVALSLMNTHPIRRDKETATAYGARFISPPLALRSTIGQYVSSSQRLMLQQLGITR